MLSDGGNAQNKDNRKLFLLTFLPPTIWIVLFLRPDCNNYRIQLFAKDGLINIKLTWVLDN